MLSVDFPETTSLPMPAAETPRSTLALRRLVVSFAQSTKRKRKPRRTKPKSARPSSCEGAARVSVPVYSRIVFRAGMISAR
jgi:hypothetical protein